MRARRFLCLLVAVVAGVVLAGCTTATSRSSVTVRYDGGALVVEPALKQPVVYDAAAAMYDLTHSGYLASNWKLGAVDFGYVTINAWVRDFHGARVPGPVRRLAWVISYDPGTSPVSGVSLPPGVRGGCNNSGKSLSQAGTQLFVVDALNDAAYTYGGAGKGVCGGPIAPSAHLAYQSISLPWSEAGPTTIRVGIPGCYILNGTPSGGSTRTAGQYEIQAIGLGPIGPCSKPATSVVAEIGLPFGVYPPQPWVHGPLGPLSGVSGS